MVRLDDGGIGASDGDGDCRIRNSARGEGVWWYGFNSKCKRKRRRIVYIPILICKARRMYVNEMRLVDLLLWYLQEGYKLYPTQPVQNTVVLPICRHSRSPNLAEPLAIAKRRECKTTNLQLYKCTNIQI